MGRNRKLVLPLSLLLLTFACSFDARGSTPATPAIIQIVKAEDQRIGGAALLPHLCDPDPNVRARAAIATGRIGSREDVPALRPLLRDPDVSVRRAATFGLGEIEDSSAATALANHFLTSGESDLEVRALCLEGLGKLGRGAGACQLALLDSDPRILAAALLAAWRIPGVEPLEDATRGCSHADSTVRRAAAYCLMRLAGPGAVGRTPAATAASIPHADRAEVIARLSALALERDPATRIHAARGLGALASEETTARLLLLREDPDWRVRVEAARGLASGKRELRRQQIDPLLGDRHPNVRVAAVEALASVGPFEEAEPRLRSLLHDRRTRIRQVAFTAYVQRQKARGDPLPIEAIDAIEQSSKELLAQKDWNLRVLAAEGAVLLPIDLALPILRAMLEDEPRVARAAIDPLLQRRARMRNDPILAQIGADLQAILSATDPVLRAVTVESLGSIFADSTLRPDPSDWLGLHSILEQCRRYAVSFDALPDVRLAVVGVAGQLASRPEMLRLLRESCEDPDYLVRRAAVESLRAAGATPPREAGPVESAWSDSAYAAVLEWAERDHWAVIEAAEGTIVVRLLSREAPLTCWNFSSLAAAGFFDRSRWHRVVPDFVLQGGCSRGDGYGGSERAIRCEITRQPFARGTLGMALSGKDTGTSQFFLTHSEQPHLDGRYTAFGVVERGQEAADRVEQGANLWSIRVVDQRP